METKQQKKVPTLKSDKITPGKRVSKILQAAKKYQGSVEILDMEIDLPPAPSDKSE